MASVVFGGSTVVQWRSGQGQCAVFLGWTLQSYCSVGKSAGGDRVGEWESEGVGDSGEGKFWQQKDASITPGPAAVLRLEERLWEKNYRDFLRENTKLRQVIPGT